MDNLGLVIIDYLQLMQSAGGRTYSGENRQQVVSDISRALKIMAKGWTCRCCASASCPVPMRAAVTSGPCCPTCVSRAPSSRTPILSCSSIGRAITTRTPPNPQPGRVHHRQEPARRRPGPWNSSGCRSSPPSATWRVSTMNTCNRIFNMSFYGFSPKNGAWGGSMGGFCRRSASGAGANPRQHGPMWPYPAERTLCACSTSCTACAGEIPSHWLPPTTTTSYGRREADRDAAFVRQFVALCCGRTVCSSPMGCGGSCPGGAVHRGGAMWPVRPAAAAVAWRRPPGPCAMTFSDGPPRPAGASGSPPPTTLGTMQRPSCST